MTSQLAFLCRRCLPFVVSAVVAFGMMSLAPIPQRLFGHDLALLAEMGYRVLSGQRPHADFYTPVGPASYALLGAGMSLAGGTAAGVSLAPLLGTLLLGATAAILELVRPRGRTLLALVAAITAASPRHFNYDSAAITSAAFYNRIGAAFVILTMTALLPPLEGGQRARRHAAARRSALLEGFVYGVIDAFLAALKPTYFAVGLVAALAGLVVARRDRRQGLLGLAGGFVVGLLPWLAFVRGAVGAALSDLALGSAIKRELLSYVGLAVVEDAAPFLAAPLALAVGALCVAGARRVPTERALAVVGTCGAALLGGGLFLLGNFLEPGQSYDFPLLAPACVVVLVTLRFRLPWKVRGAPVLAVATVVLGIGVRRDLDAIGSLVTSDRTGGRIDAPAFRGVPIARSSAECRPADYVPRMNRGLAFLRSHAPSDARLFVVDFSSPFTVALGLPPPRGTPPWWHALVNVSPSHAPPADRVLDDATHVLVPQCPSSVATMRTLLRVYDAYLSAHFAEVARSKEWILLGRVPPASE